MTRYKTVNQLVEEHPWLTRGGLRSYIFFKDSNGFERSGAIVRIGRKILIDTDKFFQWIEYQNQGNKQNGGK